MRGRYEKLQRLSRPGFCNAGHQWHATLYPFDKKTHQFQLFRGIQRGILTQRTEDNNAVHASVQLERQVLRHGFEVQAEIPVKLGGNGGKYTAPIDGAHSTQCSLISDISLVYHC